MSKDKDKVIDFPGKGVTSRLSAKIGYKPCSQCEKLNLTLERDKPFKPTKQEVVPVGGIKGICKCGAAVFAAHNYCCKCGQKLDWGNRHE
jgi:hypothetical protein